MNRAEVSQGVSMEKIRVLIKEPGKVPMHTYIPNTLESLQKNVGGYIETVTAAKDLVIICNEEGRLQGLPYNCSILGLDFVGTIILAGTDGEEFCDLPAGIDVWKSLFSSLWRTGGPC